MLSAILLLIPSLVVISDAGVEGDYGGSIFSGSGPYDIGPLVDITTAFEDRPYSSRYFAVMGDLTLESFDTNADWLTADITEPLALNTTSLEARWSFDRGDAADTSGNGHDGVMNGTVPGTGVFGIGQSMEFDGNDNINISYDPGLNITDVITVEAWIHPTFTDSGEHMILSKGSNWDYDRSQDYELTMDRDRPLFQMKPAGTDDWYGAAPMEEITKNTWHHIAGVFDGSRFMIYIDGINQTSLYDGWDSNYKGSIYQGELPNSTSKIQIGKREHASWGDIFFEGYMDEIRIFHRVVPPEEILEHATRPGTDTVTISGTPNNGDVGIFDVQMNISDGLGNYAERFFQLTVENKPPNITTEDVTSVLQDEEYRVEYDADDEGLGTTLWELDTDAPFLEIDAGSGLLTGTPTNDDVGIHTVNVTFKDGWGGYDFSEFELEVIDVNDPPFITTSELPDATEDIPYEVQIVADDIDGEVLDWSLQSGSEWLNITDDGLLHGTPANDDVGICSLTVGVQDPRGLSAQVDLEFEVSNVNDKPTWVDVPDNITIDEGITFNFDVNATDADTGDEVTYEVISLPATDISINRTTGELVWFATRDPFVSQPYKLLVMLSASDGKEKSSHSFRITVTPNAAPTSQLLTPENGSMVYSNHTVIYWEGSDPEEDEIIYHVYFSDSRTRVEIRDEEVKREVDKDSLEVYDLEPGSDYYWTVIPQDGFSSGSCTNGPYHFYVNSPPVVTLGSPTAGGRISAVGLTLHWEGYDEESHPITYDLYLGKTLVDVQDLSEGAIVEGGMEASSFEPTGLEQGATYYWMVIPNDGHVTGTCPGGPRSFVVNNPPTINPVDDQKVDAGDLLILYINGSDGDGEDILEFSLENPPEGLDIERDTGMVTWVPGSDQIGTFDVVVKLTDGIDTANSTFSIEVEKAAVEEEEEKDGGAPLSAGVIAILTIIAFILLVAIVVVILLITRKKKEEPEPGAEVEEGAVPPKRPGVVTGGRTLTPVLPSGDAQPTGAFSGGLPPKAPARGLPEPPAPRELPAATPIEEQESEPSMGTPEREPVDESEGAPSEEVPEGPPVGGPTEEEVTRETVPPSPPEEGGEVSPSQEPPTDTVSGEAPGPSPPEDKPEGLQMQEPPSETEAGEGTGPLPPEEPIERGSKPTTEEPSVSSPPDSAGGNGPVEGTPEGPTTREQNPEETSKE